MDRFSGVCGMQLTPTHCVCHMTRSHISGIELEPGAREEMASSHLCTLCEGAMHSRERINVSSTLAL